MANTCSGVIAATSRCWVNQLICYQYIRTMITAAAPIPPASLKSKQLRRYPQHLPREVGDDPRGQQLQQDKGHYPGEHVLERHLRWADAAQVRAYARFFRDHLRGCEESFVNNTCVQAGIRRAEPVHSMAGEELRGLLNADGARLED